MPNRAFNIFYADDDRDDQDFFKDAIQEIDDRYQVFPITDGQALISLLYNPPPHPGILFLDLNMPLKSGVEVLETLRSESYRKTIPIVILSTSGEQEDIEATRKLGADLYIQKPRDFAQYIGAIRYAVGLDWAKESGPGNPYVYREN